MINLSTEQREILELLEGASNWRLEYYKLREQLARRGRTTISLNSLGELTRRKLIEYELTPIGIFGTGTLGRYQLTYEGRQAVRRSA